MKNYIKLFLKTSSNYSSFAGFTLIELLVAMAITSIVVSVTGFGLVNIMQGNSKAEAETLRRIQLNRSLDFINDEVRMAKHIATDASTNLDTLAPGFDSSGTTPVLTLNIPGVSQRVIYYTKSASNPWLGPKIVYRWGPRIGNNGQYENAVNNPPPGCSGYAACNPEGWEYNALVDLMIDTTPNSTTTCPITGWSANPSSSNGQGFTACVDPTGKVAEIYLRGKLTDAYGNSLAPYQVNTNVFARSVTPIKCTVPNINGNTNIAANTAITGAGLIPKQNTISTGTVGAASNQFPPADSSVTCNTTVTYSYRPS